MSGEDSVDNGPKLVPLKCVEFVGFLAGIAAKKLEAGKSLRLESLVADYGRRIVIATIAGNTRHVPFERCDVLVPDEEAEEPTAMKATEEKRKNGKRNQPNAAA